MVYTLVEMARSSMDDTEIMDEEKALLPDEFLVPDASDTTPVNVRLWASIAINTIATCLIVGGSDQDSSTVLMFIKVFTNKRVFENEALRHVQVAFAAFHFLVTFALLYILSRPSVNIFQAKRVPPVQIIPLALAMIFNVVLTNTSLAYSSIQFYQISRIFMTPTVALLNYITSRTTIPSPAVATLVPVCLGVGIVSYFDTKPVADAKAAATSPIGVVFALAGVLASSVYTVWIKKYHSILQCSSMQLLFNQAPVSVVLMLYIIPFSDHVTAGRVITGPLWLLIGLVGPLNNGKGKTDSMQSGILACLITSTQFIIVNEAGPVSSTVVGHFKTCLIVTLGWMYSGKPFRDGSLLGIVLAIGGIISYVSSPLYFSQVS